MEHIVSSERRDKMATNVSNGKKMMGFTGLVIIGFMAMFMISGVGIYGYTVAYYFDAVESVGLVFTLESVLRLGMMAIGGKIGDKLGRKNVWAAGRYKVYRYLSGCYYGSDDYRSHGRRIYLRDQLETAVLDYHADYGCWLYSLPDRSAEGGKE